MMRIDAIQGNIYPTTILLENNTPLNLVENATCIRNHRSNV